MLDNVASIVPIGLVSYLQSLLHPFLQQVSQLHIVLLGKKEMTVALDAYFRQHHELRIAAMTVDARHEQSGHLKAHAPMVLRPVAAWFRGNVVTVIDDDWHACEGGKVSKFDRLCPPNTP